MKAYNGVRPPRLLLKATSMEATFKMKQTDHSVCPCCQHDNLEAFFTIEDAPIQSVITVDSYDAALAIPRQTIELNLCHACGFIFNRTFNRDWDYYTQGYEDQQSFSPMFRDFIHTVTNRFINRYSMRQKRIFEIGCGKGDFLQLICQLGDNSGVGLDPAWDASRAPTSAHVNFRKDFFGPETPQIDSDCIVCRHTLEHIPNAQQFVRTIRDTCRTQQPILLFEVPNMLRILQTHSFWDIFNEHCNYFTPASLAGLFRRNYFDVLDLHLEYNQQYLLIEGRPSDKRPTSKHPLEESFSELKLLVARFTSVMNKQLESWRTRLCAYKDSGRRVVLWGGGSKAVGFLTQFDSIGLIEHVVDINPYLAGNFIPGFGIQYQQPDFLKAYQPDVVIAMNGIYTKEIRSMLSTRKLYPEIIGL